MSSPKTCRNCRFFSDSYPATCRRNPPEIIVKYHFTFEVSLGSAPVVGATTPTSAYSEWPQVDPTSFCGEHSDLTAIRYETGDLIEELIES